MERFFKQSNNSRTAKLWVVCLIHSVFIMMKYIRVECEWDWFLHLSAVNNMMLLYVASKHFTTGQKAMHTMVSIMGFGVTYPFMRYSHGQSGIIGVTLQLKMVKTCVIIQWSALSSQLEMNSSMNIEPMVQLDHKEDTKSRIKIDTCDRQALHEKLEMCIDHLFEKEGTLNI